MKFAVAALIATSTAIRITAKADDCLSHEQTDQSFEQLDTNKDGSLSYDEIKVGIEAFAKQQNHTITAEEWKWIQETGTKIDSKTPGKVDHQEFNQFANAVFAHFDLCHLADGGPPPQQDGGCIDRRMTDDTFTRLDTNNNDSLSYDEIKVGIEAFAKQQNHTITTEEWDWIKETGTKIDSKTPGKVDHDEFFKFANVVMSHFGICHLADGGPPPQQDGGCIDHRMADETFKALDTNNNDSLSYNEIKVGIENVAKSKNHTITAEEWKWIQETGTKIDSKTPGMVDHDEFFKFANVVMNHFGLCTADGGPPPQQDGGCIDHRMAIEGFHQLDTNHDGSLSYDEIKVGIEDFAKQQNHTITAEEWKWIQETGAKIDSKTPGKVDEEEFYQFLNAVFEHFDLCHLVDGGDQGGDSDHEDKNCDIPADQIKGIFDHVDSNHNGKASRKEVKKALGDLAASRGHTLTKEENQWLRKQFKADNGTKGDGGLDIQEFSKFANAVSNHFQLC